MAVAFFVRFNLHNSICSNPISVEMLRPFLNQSDGEIGVMLDEIDALQNGRAERFRKKYPEQTKALGGKKVLFLGDSITSDNLGYREAVTRAAGLRGIDGSVSGGTSSMILHEAKRLIDKEKPDLVSLMIGSNDSVSVVREDLNQVSIGEYERNVGEIVRWAKQGGAKVLLFEIPPVVEERFEKSFSGQSKMQSNETVTAYNESVKRIAQENRIELQCNRWLLEDAALYERDGIHLSVSGQELFAEKWLEAAAKQYKKGELA